LGGQAGRPAIIEARIDVNDSAARGDWGFVERAVEIVPPREDAFRKHRP